MGAKTIRTITPVVLAGLDEPGALSLTGKGVRRSFSKFLSRKSLFQQSVLHVLPLGAPVVVCEERYLSIIREQLKEIGVFPRAIITEPEHRGGGVSVALVAFHLKNLNEIMFVMRSDQCVSDGDDNIKCIDTLCDYAEDRFILFGEAPKSNRNGFGCIDYSLQEIGNELYNIRQFTPQKRLKQTDGAFLLYTGVFMARPKIYLDELKKNQDAAYKLAERSYYSAKERGGVTFPSTEGFLKIRSVSLECDIMVELKDAYVNVLQCDWSTQSWPKVVKRNVTSVIKRA